jgi:transcriptional regulator with XRE-family HTH domain
MKTKIKEILKKQDRSVSFLKRRTKISRYSLDLIVSGKKSPTVEQVSEIANALDVKPENIFFDINANNIGSDSLDTTDELINKDKAS